MSSLVPGATRALPGWVGSLEQLYILNKDSSQRIPMERSLKNLYCPRRANRVCVNQPRFIWRVLLEFTSLIDWFAFL